MAYDFRKQLDAYKKRIDSDIADYAAYVEQATPQQYNDYAALVTNAYLGMLRQGGKRIRGALVIAGYEMCGGTDRVMVTRAATAIEMIHAYILIIDDIQDRSTLRRGQVTVHERLQAYHEQQKLKGDARHAGISLALNAALAGGHAAQTLLAGLSVDSELRAKVLGIVNYTMTVTIHGQTTDIMNELVPTPRTEDVARALEWKTAHYTILNPLCVGMVLAGAGCEDTDAIRGYALQTGKAFQITDDIIGTFGSNTQTGKQNIDDMREGKQTLLTLYALEHASAADCDFLKTCLGNAGLTAQDFERAKKIIRTTGALDYARAEAVRCAESAVEILYQQQRPWSREGLSFLQGLAESLPHRIT